MKACSKGTTAAACLGYALITAALFLLVLVLSGRKGEAIIHA